MLPFLTPGHPPKVFNSQCMQMHSHLPDAIPEQALHWWCPDPAAESTLGDSPGACGTFLSALKPSSQQSMMTARVSLQLTMVDRGRTMIPSTTLLLMLPVCYSNSVIMARVISSLVLVNTHTCVKERITDMMSAGPFVAGLKCSGNVFGGFICMVKREFAFNCNSSDHSS